MSILAITGAGGFVGRELLATLSASGIRELRILVHRRRPPGITGELAFVPIGGDLLKPETLRELIAPGATVIHLAAPQKHEDNVVAARNLAAACRNVDIARLVHCSTAVVVGGVHDDVITEETPCQPATAYERAKYRIEQEMQASAAGRHEIAILRPTSVFGPGGQNLVSFARRILSGNELASRAYSILQGRRRMNLVSVHNVAAALSFLAVTRHAIDQQIYIASDDDAPENNFRDVEQILRRELGCVQRPSAWSMPPALLSALLRARRRSNVNPQRVYSDAKLRALGFIKPLAFDRALAEFAHWLRARSADAHRAAP